MRDLPTGTLTFLFTDIEGSTDLWEHHPDVMRASLVRHDAIMRAAIGRHDGVVARTMGDSFFATFAEADNALTAVLDAQRNLAAEPWPAECVIRVRMALHTGSGQMRDDDYYGPALNRAARILSAGHGSQTLISGATRELVRDSLPADLVLLDLGEHRLKDLIRPEHMWQVVAPDLAVDFPPLKRLDARFNNLPVQATPFVGRERALANVCARLRDGKTRILTLTGPGGTGKTRLALQAAAETIEDFPHGVLFVPLASVTDPSLVLSSIAGVLGVREDDQVPLFDLVVKHLHDREGLIILDNFEQIIKGADVVSRLLSACPRLHVLATSRERLRLDGEHTIAVPSLDIPDQRHLPSLEVLTQYDAVALFIQRALAVQPGFRVTNDNAPAVAEICVRLEGLPLAIELAAARIRMLPPQALLSRLGNRLKVLTGGARDLPLRQQTLRGAIDWSFSLLTAPEQAAFCQLGVFFGGWSLEAAEHVCDPGDEDDVFEVLSLLLDKSLIRVEERDGEARFGMLEVIREYAIEQLNLSGHQLDAKERHAAFFLEAAEETAIALLGPEQRLLLDRMEADHDNFRAALRSSLDHGDGSSALRLSVALYHFWRLRGYLTEAMAWIEESLKTAGDLDTGDKSVALRAKALNAMGILTEHRDSGRANAAYQKSLILCRRIGDRSGEARALNSLANMAGHNDNGARKRELYEQSLKLYRELNDRSRIALLLGNLAGLAAKDGDLAQAESLCRQALDLHRQVGDPDQIAGSLWDLSQIELERGDHGAAKALALEALATWHGIGHEAGTIACLEIVARTALANGETETGVRLLALVAVCSERPELGLEGDLLDHQSQLEIIRERLGQQVFARAWNEGRNLTIEEAVTIASGES